MKLIQAIVRREKEKEVVDHIGKSGASAYTRLDVFGRGRQKGLVAGTVRYDEVPKVLLMITVRDEQVDPVVDAIKIASRTGNPGDGKIFVSGLEESRTIRTASIDQG